jgi:hypothetical protein
MNTRRLFELDVDVEKNIRMSTNEFVALSLGQIAPGSIHLPQCWDRSPSIDVIECVSISYTRAIPGYRKEHDFHVIVNATRNEAAFFHEQMRNLASRDIQNACVNEHREPSRPRYVQSTQLAPDVDRVSRISRYDGMRRDESQKAPFQAEILDHRACTQVSKELRVDVHATLEFHRGQVVKRVCHPSSRHLSHPIRGQFR